MRFVIVSLQKSGAAPLDTLGLSDALCKLGVSHTLIVSSGNERLSQLSSNDVRSVRPISTFASHAPSFIFWTLTLVRPFRCIWEIIRVRPDVVLTTHVHPWLFCLPLLQMMFRFRWGYGVHESPFERKEANGRMIRFFEQWMIRRARTVVVYSEYMHDRILQVLPHADALTIPLGAYEAAIGALTVDRRDSDRPRVVCAGRLEPYKGLDVLVAAVEILREQSIQMDVVVAGNGQLPQEMRERMDRAKIVIENRYLSPDAFTAMIISADIIVLPYTEASQSGVISFALAAGKPVVASRVGGIPEQVEDGVSGLLVPVRNPEKLAEAISFYVTNPEKRRLAGEAARRLGETRLSWNRAAERIIAWMNT